MVVRNSRPKSNVLYSICFHCKTFLRHHFLSFFHIFLPLALSGSLSVCLSFTSFIVKRTMEWPKAALKMIEAKQFHSIHTMCNIKLAHTHTASQASKRIMDTFNITSNHRRKHFCARCHSERQIQYTAHRPTMRQCQSNDKHHSWKYK